MLLVSDFLPPTPGGMEAHVRRLAEALLDRGHQVAVVSGTVAAEPLPDGATVASASTLLSAVPLVYQNRERAFPPPWPDRLFRRRVREFADRWRPDVMHAHGWSAFSSYWSESPPLVATLHDHGLRCPKRTLLRLDSECRQGSGLVCVTCPGSQGAVKRSALAAALAHSVPDLVRHASRLVAVSQSVAERLSEAYPLSSKLTVIPNFIDVDHCSSRKGSERHQPMILYVGPAERHKGRHVLIEAFRTLPKGSATLRIVGAGEYALDPGIENAGYLSGDALADQFRSASVVVVPSIWPEPCPTVVLEAMAYGCAIVGSHIGGIPDLIEHETSGLLVPAGDSTALAGALKRLLYDGTLRNSLAEAARARSKNFGTDKIVPLIESTYWRAIAERRKS